MNSSYIVVTTPDRMNDLIKLLLDNRLVENTFEIAIELKAIRDIENCNLKGSDYLLGILSKYPCNKVLTDIPEFAFELIPYYNVCVPFLDEIICHKRIWQIE